MGWIPSVHLDPEQIDNWVEVQGFESVIG